MDLAILNLILLFIFINIFTGFSTKNKNAYCGLIGFSGAGVLNPMIIKLIMCMNANDRGKDATGVYSKTTGVVKDSEIAHKFLPKNLDTIEKSKDTVFIGHVRAKSIGVNSAKNAHPFETEDLVLAHNGTITSYIDLSKEYDIPLVDWNVDSEVLILAIQKEINILRSKKKQLPLLSKYQGAANLLFHDKKDENKLYVWKDPARPLFRGWDEEGNMYISSMKEPLEISGLYEIKEFTDGHLYVIENGTILEEISIDTFAVIKARKDEEERKLKALTTSKTNTSLQNAKVKDKGLGPYINPKNPRGINTDKDGWKKAVVGLWVRVKAQIGGRENSKTKVYNFGKEVLYAPVDSFLYISEDNLSGGYGSFIVVKKDKFDKQLFVISESLLDFDNILPTIGDVMLAAVNINKTESKERLWNQGDSMFVDRIDYFNKEIGTICSKDGNIYHVPLGTIRTLSDWEKSLLDSEESFNRVNQVLNSGSEDEGTSGTEKPNTKTIDFIEYHVLCSILGEINETLDLLIDKGSAELDVTDEIARIREIITSGMDVDYLESLADKTPIFST